jgi:hypothetical protein
MLAPPPPARQYRHLMRLLIVFILFYFSDRDEDYRELDKEEEDERMSQMNQRPVSNNRNQGDVVSDQDQRKIILLQHVCKEAFVENTLFS